MKLKDLKCECGGQMEKIKTTVNNIEVRAWKCKKCKEELIHPEDAQKALEIERARRDNELIVKLRKVEKSNVVTVPQIIMEVEKLKTGQNLTYRETANNVVKELDKKNMSLSDFTLQQEKPWE